MADAVTSGILVALAFLAIGCLIVLAMYFIIGAIYIAFWPNADDRRAREMRRAEHRQRVTG